MFDPRELMHFPHISNTQDQLIVASLSYTDFNSLNKNKNIELHEYDHYFVNDDVFTITWAHHCDPIHFIYSTNYLILINNDPLFLHLRNQILNTPEDCFYAAIAHLLQEIHQATASIAFDVLSIQDLAGILTENESQDLLLRIKNTQSFISNLKNSVNMKKKILIRCTFPMFNSITKLMLLEDLINFHDGVLLVIYAHYTGELNLSLAISSNSIGQVIRTLTVITIGTIPAVAIVGFWGMNISSDTIGVPGRDYEPAFTILTIALVVLSVFTGIVTNKLL